MLVGGLGRDLGGGEIGPTGPPGRLFLKFSALLSLEGGCIISV